ncbi:MAG: site-specific integrase [Proteobacteria bacterium]|nr:site-specific integrase [Pseudomonadota bacterium]
MQPGLWDDIEPIGTPSEGKEQLHPVAAKLVFHRALTQAQSLLTKDRRRRNQPQGAAAVLCLLVLGMRSGEVVALSPWDLDDGLLRIQRGKTKTARRWVRIPKEVWSALQPHVVTAREQNRDRLFPFSRNWINGHTNRLCREIGVPEICAHGLRGTPVQYCY